MATTDSTAGDVSKATDLLLSYFRLANGGGTIGGVTESEVRAAVQAIVDTAVRAAVAVITPAIAEIGDDMGGVMRRLGSLESSANGMGY
jgi:hypothetical protein